MATRLYFANTSGTIILPTGDRSAVLPAGTDRGDFNQNLALRLQGTGTQANFTVTTATITTVQSAMMARHVSSGLAAQTINANTWTLQFEGQESNAAANAYLAASIYAWRSSTTGVVGYIYDRTGLLGVEFNGLPQTVSITGSGVTVAEGDALVFEAWYITPGQGNTTTRTITWSINNIGASPDPYAYLETPQDLFFSGQAVVTENLDAVDFWIGCAY